MVKPIFDSKRALSFFKPVYVSVNSNWLHPPGNPQGFAQQNCPGSGFDLLKLPGGREFDKGRDFVDYAERHINVCSRGDLCSSFLTIF